ETTPIANPDRAVITTLPGTYRWVQSIDADGTVTDPSTTGYQEQLDISATTFITRRNNQVTETFPYFTTIGYETGDYTVYRIMDADWGRERYAFYFLNDWLFVEESCCGGALRQYRSN
ncbi:MAG: hypothetical protein AAFU03_04270, partial [Bacteroidota bacterium]